MRWLLLKLRYTEPDEKDKRKELPRRESWMHTRGYAIVFCGLFLVTGLVNIFEVPSIGEYGVYKTSYASLMLLTGLSLGLPVAGAFMLLHSFLDTPFMLERSFYLLPSTSEHLKDLLLLVAMTAALFLLVRRLQRFRRAFKWGVYLNYVSLVLVVYYFSRPFVDDLMGMDCLGGDMQAYIPGGTVQIMESYDYGRTRGLWDKWYTQRTFLTYYSISKDGGQTWHEFMLATFQFGCGGGRLLRNTGQLNDRFFWLWYGQYAILTHDGGSTWNIWQQPGFHHPCEIEQITFTDEQNGRITCRYNEVISGLATDDGGLTWHEVKP
jgi:hypothetical protein